MNDLVVVVHGILNYSFFMKRVEWALERAGYEVLNWDYPARSRLIEEHAARLGEVLKPYLKEKRKIHFVGFSMGGLVIRHLLSHHPKIENIGRFVMIGTPNHGTALVDRFAPHAWYRMVVGNRAMMQLKVVNRDFFKELGVPYCEFGIIAGVRGDGKGYTNWLEGENDGSVTLESARLEGSKGLLEIRRSHTGLILDKETCRQAVHFVREGRFS